MTKVAGWVFLGALLHVSIPAGVAGQAPTPPPGRAYLFVLDLQGTALDEFPSSIKALNGVMTVVDKNGQHMLKASSPSEFLITLPQVLPADFTIELDVIPKGCCAPDDIMLEGTPTMNRGPASAQLTWHPERISAVGGSPDMYQAAMPEDLAAATPGNLTHVVVEFQGTQIKLYTNGRRLYTLDKQFARGRVLRVWLGGADDGLNAAYLASFRIGLGAASPSVIAGGPPPGIQSVAGGGTNTTLPTQPQTPNGSTSYVPLSPGSETLSQSQALTGPTTPTMVMAPKVTQGTPGPIVQWTSLSGATGYMVRRWLSTDPTCCNNGSGSLAGPPWQDAALLASGTYVYEVTASLTTGTPVSERTQFSVMMPVSSSTPSPVLVPLPLAPAPPPPPTPSVAPAPVAAQSGTPVRTSSAPPPGSGAAAALAPTGPPPTNISVTGTPVLTKLNWASPISGLRGVTYKVDRWLESNPTCCTGQSATLTFPAWTDEGMQWSGAYVFRITAFLPDGTFGVATTRWVRPDPVNPANFRAASVSAGFVALRWDAVPDASWYELSGPGLSLATFNATGTAYNVHNLAPGTYTWRVGTFYSSPNAPAPVSGPASAFPSVTVTVP